MNAMEWYDAEVMQDDLETGIYFHHRMPVLAASTTEAIERARFIMKETAAKGEYTARPTKDPARPANHDAIRNAKAKAAYIVEAMAALSALQDGAESVELEGDEYTCEDDLHEAIQCEALSVEIRFGWHVPGEDRANTDAEYRIALTTGGPACQLTGDIGIHGEPESARLEWQDWGTPWTYLAGLSEADERALLTFACMFHYMDA